MEEDDESREIERLTTHYIAAARECVELWTTGDKDFNFKVGMSQKVRAVFPVVAHAMAQTVAALRLYDLGLVYAARANVRVALEHAIVAQSVVHTHGGEDYLIGSMERLHTNILTDLKNSGVEIPARLTPNLVHPPAELQINLQVICRRFDPTGSFYGLYRNLSSGTHVSLATLRAYVDVDQVDGSVAFRLGEGGEHDAQQDQALGWSPVLALSAIESLRQDESRLRAVEEIAKNHELIADLRHLDTEPQKQQAPRP
ncbi:hypothetical protein AB0J80_36000 [Actinoplanes sp. NPDC049548]|uniref:hypothetical protein n=1 Tax=Actinoplanes sp. NPDC049548 TaxID=3155152 RepID=UPI00344937BA